MKLLHQIGDRKHGPNFNTLEEILACNEPLSFDGVYESVYQHYKELKGKDITFFVTYWCAGYNNAFDLGQPLSNFCPVGQVERMAEYLGAKIGYHGAWHKRITHTMSDQDVYGEIQPPYWLTKPLVLAWPYGDYTLRAIEIAKRCGYTEAWSALQGDDTNPFAKRRTLLNW